MLTGCWSTASVKTTTTKSGGNTRAGCIAGRNNGTINTSYWINENLTSGVGSSSTDSYTKVDGDTTTWLTAESAMNAAIPSDTGWKYEKATTTEAPTLTKSNS